MTVDIPLLVLLKEVIAPSVIARSVLVPVYQSPAVESESKVDAITRELVELKSVLLNTRTLADAAVSSDTQTANGVNLLSFIIV